MPHPLGMTVMCAARPIAALHGNDCDVCRETHCRTGNDCDVCRESHAASVARHLPTATSELLLQMFSPQRSLVRYHCDPWRWRSLWRSRWLPCGAAPLRLPLCLDLVQRPRGLSQGPRRLQHRLLSLRNLQLCKPAQTALIRLLVLSGLERRCRKSALGSMRRLAVTVGRHAAYAPRMPMGRATIGL